MSEEALTQPQPSELMEPLEIVEPLELAEPLELMEPLEPLELVEPNGQRIPCERCGAIVARSHTSRHQQGLPCRTRSKIRDCEQSGMKATTHSRADWLQRNFGVEVRFAPIAFHSGSKGIRSKVTHGHWVSTDLANALGDTLANDASRLDAMLRYATDRIACTEAMVFASAHRLICVRNGAYPAFALLRALLKLQPKACAFNQDAHMEVILALETTL